MEDWDVNEWQGRRKDQVEKSYGMAYVALGLLTLSVLTDLIYLYLN
jgi:hypothetical protein